MTEYNGTIASVDKAFDTLEYLRENGKSSLSTIATDLGFTKSTAHRHLKTLESREYVVGDDGSYRLSLRFLDFGEFTRRRHTEYQLIREKVEALAEQTDERVQFMVEEHGRAVYVFQQSGQHAVEADTYPGKRVPIHASAAGLAILSKVGSDAVDEVVSRHGLIRLTSKTIADRETLDEELHKARARGYSINDQGVIEGLRAIGAPVTGPDDEVIGGLSISGPLNRMEGERFENDLPSLLLGVTNELELNIAYQ